MRDIGKAEGIGNQNTGDQHDYPVVQMMPRRYSYQYAIVIQLQKRADSLA